MKSIGGEFVTFGFDAIFIDQPAQGSRGAAVEEF